MNEWYEDECFCDHCNADTRHKFKDSDHERDSSGNYRECLTCGWWRTGMDDTYYPPLEV